jgi:UDP-N-acetylmuramate-alanine ligase
MPTDVILMLGAGDIDQLVQPLQEQLQNGHPLESR